MCAGAEVGDRRETRERSEHDEECWKKARMRPGYGCKAGRQNGEVVDEGSDREQVEATDQPRGDH